MPRVPLGVKETVGTFGRQLGIDAALDSKTLVFREVPVEDVELDRGHTVECALDDGDGSSADRCRSEDRASGSEGRS